MERLPTGDMKLDELDMVILKALEDGPKSRQELLALAPTGRTGQRRINTLVKYGFIERVSHGSYGLGEKGRSLLAPATVLHGPPLHDEKIKQLIAMLPTAAHRSLYRLTLDGIVAKYLLLDKYGNNWPCSIIGGTGKEFKTGMAWSLCLLVDELDPGRSIRAMQFPSPKEITVRRQKGKENRINVDISPLLSEPFVCFDEYDKSASREVKRQVELFLDGRREFPFEREMVINHAYPFITLNTTPEKFGIPGPYIRRSVVVNAERLKSKLTSIDLAAEEIHRFQESDNEAPRLSLKSLTAPEISFSPDDFLFLRDVFMQNVQEGYEKQVDTKPLEILTMGRLVLLGSDDLKEAIFFVVWDRLECLETMLGTRPGWRERIADIWSQAQNQVPEEIREAAERARKDYAKSKETQAQADTLEKGKTSLTVEVNNILHDLPTEAIWSRRIQPFSNKLQALIPVINETCNFDDLKACQEKLQGIIDALTLEKMHIAELKHTRAALRKELDGIELYLSSYAIHTGKPVNGERELLQTLSDKLVQADSQESLGAISVTIQDLIIDLRRKRNALEAEEAMKQSERDTRERLEKEHLESRLRSKIKDLKTKLTPYSSELKAFKEMNTLTRLENDVRRAEWSSELIVIEEYLATKVTPWVEQLVAGFAFEEKQQHFIAQIQSDIDALTQVLNGTAGDVAVELERLGCGRELDSGSLEGLDGTVYRFSWVWPGETGKAGPLAQKRLEELRALETLVQKTQTLSELANLRKRYKQPFVKLAARKKKAE